MGAASSPERFVRAAARRAARRARSAPRLPQAHRDPPARRGRARSAAPTRCRPCSRSGPSLDDAGGRPVALLLDEATEIRSLAYFAGLREVDGPFGAALGPRARGTILATSYPTAARRLWPELDAARADRRSRPASSLARPRRGADARRAGPRVLRLAALRARPARRRRAAAAPSSEAWARGDGARADGSSGRAATPTRRCCCAAAATACPRRCWPRWRRRKG